MNVYQYDRRRQRALKPVASRLGEELLRANGYPTTGVIELGRYRMSQELSLPLPSDCSGTDMRAFMERVRALATQI